MLDRQTCPTCPICGNRIEDGEYRHFVWNPVEQVNIRVCGNPECTKKMARLIFRQRKAAKKEKATLNKG